MSNSLLAAATTTTATTTSSSSSSSTSSTQSLGQDAFLKMFMAQMTNQNPLDPMDNTEFTAQLAQFSSLEQLTQINESLAGLSSLESAITQTQVLSYIGKDVTLSGDQLPVTSGEAGTVNFTLASSATVKVTFTDSSGSTVATRTLGTMAAGEQSYTWDALTDSGTVAPDGTYTVTVTATSSDGSTVSVSDMSVTGRVTGFKKDSDGTIYLLSGTAWADLSDVISVTESKSSSNSSSTTLSDLLSSEASSAGQSVSEYLKSLLGLSSDS